MNLFTLRPWASMDRILQWIGRGAARLLGIKRHSTEEESTADAMTGGALVCTAIGAVAGFFLSYSSRNIDAVDGTILGALLGVCIGITFGSFVETVDDAITNLLGSLGSK